MTSGTLTQRVVWALTGSVVIFVVAMALLVYYTFDEMEDDLVEQILTTETARVAQHVAADPHFLPDRGARELGGSMRAWLHNGQVRDDMPAPLQGLSIGLHRLEPGNETWHVMVTQTPRGHLYVLYDATDHEARVGEFGMIVLAMGTLCVIAAYALSRRIAAVTVAPLLDLTGRLSNWAPGAPDLAVTRNDEAGRLIEAFNRVQNQVDHSIARQREFTANLSHEVRTPLAAIRSDVEIMLLNPAVVSDTKQRLDRIVANVDHIVASMESARAIASDRPRPAENVALAACMDDAWGGLEAEAAAAGLSFQNRIPEDSIYLLDRYALLTVLRNLVRNAIEHAAPATLTASLNSDGLLELRDTGKGIPPDELPFVFQRYYSGRLHDTPDTALPDGGLPRGLGLAIAKQVCDMQGWQLQVASTCESQGHGTRFLLRLG